MFTFAVRSYHPPRYLEQNSNVYAKHLDINTSNIAHQGVAMQAYKWGLTIDGISC